jgi:hypothetical protein
MASRLQKKPAQLQVEAPNLHKKPLRLKCEAPKFQAKPPWIQRGPSSQCKPSRTFGEAGWLQGES